MRSHARLTTQYTCERYRPHRYTIYHSTNHNPRTHGTIHRPSANAAGHIDIAHTAGRRPDKHVCTHAPAHTVHCESDHGQAVDRSPTPRSMQDATHDQPWHCLFQVSPLPLSPIHCNLARAPQAPPRGEHRGTPSIRHVSENCRPKRSPRASHTTSRRRSAAKSERKGRKMPLQLPLPLLHADNPAAPKKRLKGSERFPGGFGHGRGGPCAMCLAMSLIPGPKTCRITSHLLRLRVLSVSL